MELLFAKTNTPVLRISGTSAPFTPAPLSSHIGETGHHGFNLRDCRAGPVLNSLSSLGILCSLFAITWCFGVSIGPHALPRT